MRKSRKKQLIAVIMGGLMALSLFTGVGTVQVDAKTYASTSGTVDVADLKVGDIVYKGVQLNPNVYIILCPDCKKIWILNTNDTMEYMNKYSEVKGMPEHKNHTVNYPADFNWYFDSANTASNNQVQANVPYTIAEIVSQKYTITYNTNGGNSIAGTKDSKLPSPLPTPTRNLCDFLGWYTDAAFTTEAVPGASISQNTTLYAKWKAHEHTYSPTWTYDTKYHWHKATCSHTTEVADTAEHTYGETGEARYTCTVCGYVDNTKEKYILAIEDAKKKIQDIGEVTYDDDCYSRIKAAQDAFNALSPEQKKEITTEEQKVLTDAVENYAKLEEDHKAAAEVIEKIDQIGEVKWTNKCEENITAARNAYNALTDAQKKLVSNVKTLDDAEKSYEKLTQDYEAIGDVKEKILAIGDVKYPESKAAIDAAKNAYNELKQDQQELLQKDAEDTYKKLIAAEKEYEDLKKDHEAAKAVVDKIDAIRTVEYTKESKDKIDAAKAAYGELSDYAKTLITNYKVLTDAENTYAKLKEDHEKADAVEKAIEAIGEVEYSEESYNKINVASVAYSELTDAQKALVSNVKKLTDAVSTYEKLEKDNEEAWAVAQKILDIGEVEYTSESKTKIDEARNAYENLTDEQKAIMSTKGAKIYKKLEDAEAKYKELKAADDAEKAAAAVEKIEAIKKVEYTTESKVKIDEARDVYDALTEDQKKLITEAQYKALTDAESTYAKLESSAEYRDNSLTMNSKFKIKAGKSVKVSWGKVKGADGYDVYLAYRGKGKKFTVKSTKASSVTVRKLKKKAIDQKKNIKCYVVAYKKVNGRKQQIGKTKVFYAVGSKIKSVTEPKAIKLKKSSYVLTAGKTAKVKATIVKKNKRRKLQKHTAKFRYATSDSKVAVVSKTGKITAKAAGTCKVYVYAANGCAKVVKVTVR